eukprot:TRINITY_DN36890_c0_g1_i1.p1 TRINITY_DN36890_c0_g1~~TRINITY_DN36890_c0_g1_i1.p1  ORF type:complete len:1153 (-),score=60.37 TRINITY_DN36890_c0_g1_i1:1028-4486(-)
MFEKIDSILREIENSNEEINILLNMANISFVDYVMIKRGQMTPPQSAGVWSIQSIDVEVENLKEAIDALGKIKKEVLTFRQSLKEIQNQTLVLKRYFFLTQNQLQSLKRGLYYPMQNFINNLKNSIVSMKTTGLLLVIFAFAMAVATFIENDYGTQSAKALIYNAKWFELLLFLLALNLLGNIFKYKMYQKDKFPIFIFHVSFLVILLGAAITRFIGFEGVLHIREGESSNTMLSERAYVELKVQKDGTHYEFESPVLFSALGSNNFQSRLDLDGEELKISLENYIPSAVEELTPSSSGKSALSLVVARSGESPSRVLLKEGESKSPQGLTMAFKPNALSEIIIYKKDGKLMLRGAASMSTFDMDTQEQKTIDPQTEIPFEKRKLYSSGDKQFVLQEYMESADTTYKSAPKSQSEQVPDLLKFKVQFNGDSKDIYVFGKKGVQSNFKTANVGGLNLALGYGAKTITLPFSIALNDFILKRYPGSMAPASYRSEVRVIDSPQKSFDYSIYMNHILEHKGYRFYQASYDMDEKGTILSVNHDYWGTLVTYIGYFLLSIGMIAAIFLPKGRILNLSRRIKNLKALSIALLATLALLVPNPANAESPEDIAKAIDSVSLEHSKKFGRLLVQDVGGRVKPIETLAFEMVNKVHRGDDFHGLHPTQVLLGMLVRPDAWEKVKFISINHPELKDVLGLKKGQKYAAFIDFFDTDAHGSGVYKLGALLEEANQKRPAYQSKLDKEAIKADERLNITYMVYTGSILNIFPLPGDKAKKWFNPIDAIESFPKEFSDKVKELTYGYFEAVEIGMNSGEWEQADAALERIEEFQRFYGISIIPSESKIDAEIFYYNYNFFELLMPIFGIAGLLLMIMGVLDTIKPFSKMNIVLNSGKVIFLVAFLIQTAALALRWYISGHAPWSNGYESMIYISWATILAGLLLVRNNPLALGASGFLTAVVLFVAHLSWMDPQITNLVPVLDSYWLTIHVSVITASYGFFGLGALLGLLTLILMILKRENSKIRLEKSIAELTYINEIALIIGLALLTIGNFLGGVWANESWGRYWGWDPKETWSLITIVIYAFVLHMRFIKGLYSFYSFNIGSILAFFSVLMTYFGVNFYLSGLHSYAKGDPVPIPIFVYVMVATIFLLIGLAYKNREQSIK